MSQHKPNQSNVIRINLADSIDAKGFDANHLIHRQEFEMAEQLIQNKVQAPETSEGKGPHDAISIFGPRGSGKTSFLYSLKDKYKFDGQVQVLDVIDPTLVEEKGHVFLNIIANVSELVVNEIRKADQSPKKVLKPSLGEWKQQLLSLSAGLPAIDGIGKELPDSWADPEFIMETGLQAVESAKNLRKNLHKLLEIALKILDKEVFLLFFDDIDVDAKKGHAVLETIRKYLTTSKLITVLTGDAKLYSTGIRQSKWKNFGSDILHWEGDKMNRIGEFNDLVTELTGQYFLKVLQPTYRIHLTTLLEKRQWVRPEKLPIEIGSVNNALGNDANIEKVYSYVIEKAGVSNSIQAEVYITFLLSLPLRTQIQYFIALDKLYGPNVAEKSNTLITELFMEDLLDKKVNVNLANHTPKFLCSIMLKVLLQQRKLLDLYQLQPSSDDTGLNGVFFSFWMLFGSYTGRGDSYLIFDYFVKVAYVRNLLSILPYRNANSSMSLASPSIEGLCDVGDVFNDGVLRDVVSTFQAYLFGTLERNGPVPSISPFFVRLNRYQDKLDRRPDTMHTVFQDTDQITRSLAFIPCFDAPYGTKNESRTLYSVYVLIAAIGEIVKRVELIQPEDKELLIIDAINQLSQFRSYPIPDFVDDLKRPVEDPEGQDSDFEFEDAALGKGRSMTSLAGLMDCWINGKPKSAISTHLLGKIFTRFFYSMNNIAAEAKRRRDIKLGGLFHAQIAAFMNAALVEDVTEHLEGVSLDINNTRLSDKVFVNNLLKMTEEQLPGSDKLELSKWLLCCPLLIAFLDANKQIKSRILFYCGAIAHEECFRFNVSERLNEVQILFPKAKLHGSPLLLDDPLALIEFLKANNIRKIYFQRAANAKTNQGRVNSIIRRVSSVFGTGSEAVRNIENFRRYLKENPSAWR